MNTPMRASITQGRSNSKEILAVADATHQTMRRDGLEKASLGMTTLDEVLRATQDSEDVVSPVGVRKDVIAEA